MSAYPHPVIPAEQYVRFEYDKNDFFEVRLNADGSLSIRTGGSYADLISIVPEVANKIALVPLRWDVEKFVPFRSKKGAPDAQKD